MPFDRPTLPTLINRARSDIETRIASIDAILRRSFERAVAFMAAGLAHGNHSHMFFLSKQILPDTGDDDTVRRWANILEIPIKDAAFATGLANFTGTGTTLLPEDTEWQDADGNIYLVDADVNLIAGAITTSVTAQESGDFNLDGTTPLTIVTPVAGIDKDATVDGDGITGGALAEDVESLRARVLTRLREPPNGGGPTDYEQEALTVAGVTRAWETGAEDGLGTVTLRFATDNEVSPIPTVPKIAEVQVVLDAFAPITVIATAKAPTEALLDPEIILTPDTAAIRIAVTAELEAYLLRESNPKEASTLFISQINEAISIATGEVDHVLVLPAADVAEPLGTLTTLGTITWS